MGSTWTRCAGDRINFFLFRFSVFSRPEGSRLTVDCSIKADLHLISAVLFGGGVPAQKPAVFI